MSGLADGNRVDELPRSPECPICGAVAPVSAHAVVAPFIVELSGLPRPTYVALRSCSACDLDFFDGRFSDEQLAAIYGGYRSSRYFEIRKRWEPWYSRSVNDAYTGHSVAVDERRGFMDSVIGDLVSRRPPRLVVDFGGDEGQFIPEWPGARRVVCDVSDKSLPPGVERIESLASLGVNQPSLVIVAHVLEHLVDPVATLREVHESLAGDGLLYVEVPLDRPKIRPWHASETYRSMLIRASRNRAAFIPLDFATGVSRQYRRRFPRIGAVKESEHINYFSRTSLRELLSVAGFAVVSEKADAESSVGGLKIGRLGMAAVKGGGNHCATREW